MAPTLLLSLEQVYKNKVGKSYSIAKQSNEGNTETSRKKSDTNQTDNEECEYII